MNRLHGYGFSIVEILVGLTLGAIFSTAVLGIYIAQKSTFKTNESQANIQNTESAITALLSPAIRSAGYCGCTTISKATSNLNAGGPPPLSTLTTLSTMVMGYESATNTIPQNNPANSTNAANWSPSLDASLVGNVAAASDVLVVLGGTPGEEPIAVTSFTLGSSSFDIQSAAGVTSGQFAAISDCLKATIFNITSVAGNTISHVGGNGALSNINDTFSVNYPVGSQFVTLTQTAFFVSQDPSGQSALMRGTLNANGTWSIQSLASGVDSMQVRFGTGTNGIPTQYVAASAVTNWSQVYAVRIGFLIEGNPGSQTRPSTQYSILGTTITVPADNRLRDVFEMTIQLRNAAS